MNHDSKHLNSAEAVIDFIFDRFERAGSQSYGEEVTMQEHCLQAATFAQHDGQADSMVAACLLHDFGHLLHDLGDDIAKHGVDAHHKVLGANELKKWFPDSVVEPGRLHVEAKRYLCATDPDYLNELSEASRLSLDLQGGPMSDEEVTAFEKSVWFRDAITLRRFDDLGKQTDFETPPLGNFRALLERQLEVQ